MNKDELLSRMSIGAFYKGLIPSLKINGKTESQGLCPFHEDRNPSLSVNIETGLYNCFSCGAGGDVFRFYQDLKKVNFTTAMKEIASAQGIEEVKSKVIGTFLYHNAEGNVLYKKERIEPGKNGRPKDFYFSHPRDSQWVSGRGCDPVLYNLPVLLKSKYAFIVEGEAKVNLLISWGLAATTLDTGAKTKPQDYDLSALHGKEKIVILPDNDEPGRSYALKIAEALHGHIGEIKIVSLPELPEKGDIIDWVKTEGNNKDRLLDIVRQAPVWSPQNGLVFTRVGDLLSEPETTVEWLVEDHLPLSGLSVLAGKPKGGKSTLARCLAYAVSRGLTWLGFPTRQGIVFYLALEEKRSEVRSHFKAMGADSNDPIFVFVSPSPQDGLQKLRDAAEKQKPSLIIIDPLLKMVRLKDANDYAQVTAALEPVLTLARETGAHILTVHHTGKGDRSGGDSILGSTAIFAAVDTALLLKRTEQYRTLHSIQRYGEDMEEIVLEQDPENRIITAGVPRKEADETRMAEAILGFLGKQSEKSVEEKEIHEGVEGRKTLKVKALRDLFNQRKVTRTGEGKRGSPYLYSISGSLVPNNIREPEKPETENIISPSKIKPESGSRENKDFGKYQKCPEQEKDTQTGLFPAGPSDPPDLEALGL